MKLLSSTSSSASSDITTSTASFDNNCRSSSSRCLTTVLRRLLCFNILPTNYIEHSKGVENESLSLSLPYDQLGEIKERNHFVASDSANAPGIVARLMVLDSIPRIHPTNAQLSPAGHIARSGSMNSVDSTRELEQMQGSSSRRVKSSSSVLEALTFVELKDEQFYILSFDNAYRRKKVRSRRRKSEKGIRESEQRNSEMLTNRNSKPKKSKDENIENQAISKMTSKEIAKGNNSGGILVPSKNSNENLRVSEGFAKRSKIMCPKQNSDDKRRSSKNIKEKCLEVYGEIDGVCKSENTSPVSVLDFAEFPVDQEAPKSEEDSRLRGPNARRTLVEELKNYKNLDSCKQNTFNSSGDCQPKRTEGRKAISSRKDWERHNHAELWTEVCKLAEPGIWPSNWIYIQMRKPNEFEVIGEVLGLQIFEQLLFELLDHLCESR